jgi:hypothetical protein
MATAYEYTFYGLSGLEDDTNYMTERQNQNVKSSNYLLNNFRSSSNSLSKSVGVATSQPAMIASGGPGIVGVNGHNIDADSKLRIATTQTNPRSRIALNPRTYVTVPYLGRGVNRPAEELRLQQGDAISGRKTETGMTELSSLDHHYTPMISEVKDKISNPEYLVEGVASEGWIRGGLPTREYTRAKKD